MASFSYFKDLVEATTCQICLEEYNGRQAKMLQCLHVFCKDCLQKLLGVSDTSNTPSDNTIICPTCRKITHLPQGSVDDLLNDFHYKVLEEIKTRVRYQHAVCGLCENRSQQDEVCIYCFGCHSSVCQTCWNKHDRHFKDHQHVKVTAAAINHLMCTDHNIHCQHFCMRCRRIICTKCCTGMHLDHEIYDLCFDGNEVGNALRNLFLDSLQEASKAMSDLDIHLNCFNQGATRTRAELKCHRDHLVRLVDEQYEKACVELDLKVGQIHEAALKYQKNLMNFKDSIEKLLNNSKSWLQPMQGIPQARIMRIDELASEVREQMPHLPAKEKLPIICFIPGNGNSSFGQIVEQEAKHEDAMKAPQISEVLSLGSLYTSKPRLSWTAQTGCVNSIVFVDEGKCLATVCDGGLKVYDKRGHRTTHQLSAICKERLCAISTDWQTSTVVLTEWSVSPEAAGLVHICNFVDSSWQHNSCSVCIYPPHVALTSSEEIIISDGELLCKYFTNGRKAWHQTLSGWFAGMCVDRQNRILISFQDAVLAYNETGQEATLITKHGQSEFHGLCVDDDNNILICDWMTNSILLYNEQGKFIRQLVKMDWTPWSVALSKDRHMAVCGYNERHAMSVLCMYDI